MDKIKLDRVLFEFMETRANKKKYNYEIFISNLADIVEFFDYELYCESSELKELSPYFEKDKKEETLEKLLKAYMFGYEEESDTYTIVLFEKSGVEFVLWEIEGDYIISTRDGFIENESAKKSFTRAEILNKFPKLWPLAQKNK